jgi:HK97 family phage portal protein
MGVGLYAQSFGYDYFANGGHPPGTFRNTTQDIVDQGAAAAIKARVGAAIRTREPLVYGKDWEYTPLSVSPAEAQFLETIRATATQVATIYSIPAEMIGGDTGRSMTYATVELNSIQYVQWAVRPWLATIEAALSALLPERQYVKFNADALIRTDTKTRYEVYEIARKIGLQSQNEQRRLEDLPAVPGGDDHSPLGTNLTPPGTPTSGSAPVAATDNGDG